MNRLLDWLLDWIWPRACGLRQPLWRRIPYWMAYGLARLVIGFVGLSGRF